MANVADESRFEEASDTVTLADDEALSDVTDALTVPSAFADEVITLVDDGSGGGPATYDLVQSVALLPLRKQPDFQPYESDNTNKQATTRPDWRDPAVPWAFKTDIVNRSGGQATFRVRVVAIERSGVTAFTDVDATGSSGGGTADWEEDGILVEDDADPINVSASGAASVDLNPDGSGGITFDISATDNDTQLTDEQVQDIVGAFVSAGSNVSVDYDDANDVLTINATDTTLSTEAVQDIVGGFVTGGTDISVTYDDAGDTLTIDSTAAALTQEEVEDTVAGLLTEGQNVTLTYDDSAGTLTIDATDTTLSNEEVRDIIAPFVVGGTDISVTHDDANDTLTIDSTAAALSAEDVEDTVAALLTEGQNITLTYDDANDTLTIDATDSTLSNEEVRDIIAPFVVGGTNVTVTHDDGADTLTIDATQRTDEEIEDVVGALITAGSNTTVDYDDANDTLTITASPLTQIATGTITATGGAGVPGPAYDDTLIGVTSDQLQDFIIEVSVEQDPAWNADYAFNFDDGQEWDDSANSLNVPLTVNWDTDPGAGNDLILRWRALEP